MSLEVLIPYVMPLAVAGWVGFFVALWAVLVWHHRRWVAYHERKGLSVPATGPEVLWAELVDGVRLVVDYLRGLFRDGLRRPAEVRGAPVLCVHGYTQNGTNFVRIRQVLEAEGRPTLAISMWHRLAPMSWYLARLERTLEHAVGLDPDGIDVVCHSMGGVLLRAVLSRRPDLARSVRTVVTLGSPHQGTAAPRGIPWLPEVQALKRRSSFLAELPSLPELVPQAVTVAGTLDTIVYPVSSALAEGADHVVIAAGHAGLLTRPEAVEAVRRALVGRSAA
jgi:pimeloyl-ACP methyl ester carboxylesterase